MYSVLSVNTKLLTATGEGRAPGRARLPPPLDRTNWPLSPLSTGPLHTYLPWGGGALRAPSTSPLVLTEEHLGPLAVDNCTGNRSPLRATARLPLPLWLAKEWVPRVESASITTSLWDWYCTERSSPSTSVPDRGASGPLQWQDSQAHCTASRFYAGCGGGREVAGCLWDRADTQKGRGTGRAGDGATTSAREPLVQILDVRDYARNPQILKIWSNLVKKYWMYFFK